MVDAHGVASRANCVTYSSPSPAARIPGERCRTMIKRIVLIVVAVGLLALLAASILTSRQSGREAFRQDEALKPGYDDALAAAQRHER